MPWGVRLKLERSDALLSGLEDQIVQWQRRTGLPRIIQRWDSDARAVVFEIDEASMPPAHWSAVFADIVHNIRVVLDQMASATAFVLAGARKGVYFPYVPEPPSTKKGNTFAAQARSRWPVVDTAMLQIVEEFQPWRARPDRPEASALWLLSKADNEDKHNLTRPTVAVPLGFHTAHVTPGGDLKHDPRTLSNLIYPDDPPGSWNAGWLYPRFTPLRDIASIDELITPTDAAPRSELLRVRVTPTGPRPQLDRGDGFGGIAVTFGHRSRPLTTDRVRWLQVNVRDIVFRLTHRTCQLMSTDQPFASV